MAKGIAQNNPPSVPIATTVIKVIGSEFGIPKRGPNKGIIDVKHPIGIRILRLTSGQLTNSDIAATMYAENTANETHPPHNTAIEPGSNSGMMNTTSISIASIAPVAAPEKRMFFQFINSPNPCFLIIPRVRILLKPNSLIKSSHELQK